MPSAAEAATAPLAMSSSTNAAKASDTRRRASSRGAARSRAGPDRHQPAADGGEHADDERPRRARRQIAEATSVNPLKTTAPSVIGTRSRNEKRAAESRSRPRNRAAVIVIPERETPGIERRALREPDRDGAAAGRGRPARRVCGRRSAHQSTRPKTASKIAICHGSPRFSAIWSAEAAPTIPAGTVAMTTNHAIRSSGVSTAAGAACPATRSRSATTSRQK